MKWESIKLSMGMGEKREGKGEVEVWGFWKGEIDGKWGIPKFS